MLQLIHFLFRKYGPIKTRVSAETGKALADNPARSTSKEKDRGDAAVSLLYVVLPTECSTRVRPLAFAALSAPFSRRFLFPLEAQINYYHGRADSTVLQPAAAATKAIVADTDAAVRPLFDPHRSTSNNESVYFLFNLRGDSSPADQVSGGR